MIESPDAVLIYIPLMKGIGMSWEEIKRTPRLELEALLGAMHEHDAFHAMDGYDAQDVGDMAKHKPAIRSHYNKYMEKRAKYEEMVGNRRKATFDSITGI